MQAPALPAPRYATLFRLAWPIVLARATQSVIGFSDALMTAPLGEAPLAAVTMGSLNAFAAIILPTGTVFIVQSFAAQLRGRGELQAVSRYAWYGLGLAFLAGLLALAAIPALPLIVTAAGFEPVVRELMTTYMAIRLLSVLPAVGIEAIGSWYGGLGLTRPAMLAGLVAMGLNVVGNYLFIEGNLGMPALGVAGAAWASVAASFAGFVTLLALFLLGFGHAHPVAPRGLSFRELRRVLRFGLPNGMNWFLEFTAFVFFLNVVVGHLGTTVLAALNVVLQLNSISFMPAFGVASSGAILVGEAIGRRAHDSVWPIVKMTGTVTTVWMGSVGLVYVAFPHALIGLFRPRGVPAEELLSVGATMLALSCIWQLFDALAMTLSEALRAAGDTAWCMGARVVLAWVVFTPAAWTLVVVFGGGVGTVMTCLIVYLGALSLVLALRFASGRWRSFDLVGEPELTG